MDSLKVFTPFITEKTKNYSNWSEVFKDGTSLISKLDDLINTSKKQIACEQWIFNTNHFLKAQKVKDDSGFSKPLIFILSRNVGQDTSTKQRSFEIENLKKVMGEKISILRSIREETTSPVSKTKIFDYKNGEYFLNNKHIKPNIHTLYYVLFDATYQISPDGGEILYSELKKYLVKKGSTYRTKNSSKEKTFTRETIKSMRKLVKNNLLGLKGILKVTTLRKYLAEKRKPYEPPIFSAVRNTKTYTFNNTQFK